MAISGLRNRRIRIYAYSNVGTNGRVVSSYAYQGEYWGAFRASNASERLAGTQGEQVSDAIVTLLDSIPMPDHALVRVNFGGQLRYLRVFGLPQALEAQQSLQWKCTWIDDDAFTLTGEP